MNENSFKKEGDFLSFSGGFLYPWRVAELKATALSCQTPE